MVSLFWWKDFGEIMPRFFITHFPPTFWRLPCSLEYVQHWNLGTFSAEALWYNSVRHTACPQRTEMWGEELTSPCLWSIFWRQQCSLASLPALCIWFCGFLYPKTFASFSHSLKSKLPRYPCWETFPHSRCLPLVLRYLPFSVLLTLVGVLDAAYRVPGLLIFDWLAYSLLYIMFGKLMSDWNTSLPKESTRNSWNPLLNTFPLDCFLFLAPFPLL